MKVMPWLVILCFCLIGCSGSKSSQKVDESSPQIELSDADEFIENPTEEAAFTDDIAASSEPSLELDDSVSVIPTRSETSFSAGTIQQYKVQKNETLMLIAFKIYGDYEKWKLLAGHNKGVLKGNDNIKEGMVLNYPAPAEEFIWNPQGNPYLIRTGDTLGIISKNVYANVKKWKLLWENNRPLIKDPNKIYAGFTLYYIENGREVAAEL